MANITKSGDFYSNASNTTLRITFKASRESGVGSVKFTFDAPGKPQKAIMASSADVFFVTGEVEPQGEVKMAPVSGDDAFAVEVVDVSVVS